MKKEMSITEVAEVMGITRQAVYVAVKSKKLKASKFLDRWFITEHDVREYIRNKYSSSKKVDEHGKLVFSAEKGIYSPYQLSAKFNVPVNRIYYLIRANQLPFKKSKCSYLIDIEDFKKCVPYKKVEIST